MHDTIQIRDFEPTIQDYAALAAIGASTPPPHALDYEHRDAGDWRALDATFARAGRPLVRYVAEVVPEDEDGEQVPFLWVIAHKPAA